MERLFGSEYSKKVADLLTSTWGNGLSDESFSVGGRHEPGFVQLNVTIEKKDRSFRYVMEFRVPLKENAIAPEKGRELALDFAGHYLDQYFESERDLLLPLDFNTYEIGEHSVLARGDVSNPRLDEMADGIIERGVPLRDGENTDS